MPLRVCNRCSTCAWSCAALIPAHAPLHPRKNTIMIKNSGGTNSRRTSPVCSKRGGRCPVSPLSSEKRQVACSRYGLWVDARAGRGAACRLRAIGNGAVGEEVEMVLSSFAALSLCHLIRAHVPRGNNARAILEHAYGLVGLTMRLSVGGKRSRRVFRARRRRVCSSAGCRSKICQASNTRRIQTLGMRRTCVPPPAPSDRRNGALPDLTFGISGVGRLLTANPRLGDCRW